MPAKESNNLNTLVFSNFSPILWTVLCIVPCKGHFLLLLRNKHFSMTHMFFGIWKHCKATHHWSHTRPAGSSLCYWVWLRIFNTGIYSIWSEVVNLCSAVKVHDGMKASFWFKGTTSCIFWLWKEYILTLWSLIKLRIQQRCQNHKS